ncbi:MAG: hypothetical protein Q9168_006823 [Polycauliona sp. 1 TL-2023]
MEHLNLPEFGLLQGLMLPVVVLGLYYIGSVIHCLFFHPLAKYPGPFFAKFSVWPSYYHTTTGNRHIWILQCHETYGPIFRSGPNSVLFNSPKANRAIYEAKSNVKKDSFYLAFPQKAGAFNTWSATNHAEHARKRRILNAAFSDKALRNSEPYIIQHVDRWCELLVSGTGGEWSQPRDMAEWSDRLVFDILGMLVGNSPWLSLWLWLKPRGLNKAFKMFAPKNIADYIRFIESNLASRLSKEKDGVEKGMDSTNARKDMFHHLFHAKDPLTGGPGYSIGELFEETNLLVIAGSDTTSTVIPAMFFYMTRNPGAYQKLTREIRQTFKNLDGIHAGPKLTSCRYLRAFIDETMRMNPPVGGDLTREVLAGGTTVEGQYLPEGTILGVSAYALHHNEAAFPDSFQFQPERWLTEDTDARESSFAPFSMGPRGCPGKNLGYLEMSITMAKVLYLCDVKVTEDNDLGDGNPNQVWGRRNKGHYQTWDRFISIRHGPIVQFRKRQV